MHVKSSQDTGTSWSDLCLGLIVFLQYSFYVKVYIKYHVLRTVRTYVGYVYV
jgi:hypothetical protein